MALNYKRGLMELNHRIRREFAALQSFSGLLMKRGANPDVDIYAHDAYP
jgi:hypothetical protein